MDHLPDWTHRSRSVCILDDAGKIVKEVSMISAQAFRVC
jgi:hypothetical protein